MDKKFCSDLDVREINLKYFKLKIQCAKYKI